MPYLDPEITELLDYFDVPELPETKGESVDLSDILYKSDKYISKLDPSIQPLAKSLILECLKENIKIELTSGYRTLNEQSKLYNQGRTGEGDIVTDSKPGYSFHNWGLGFDVAPLNEKGEPYWPNDNALWDKIGSIGKRLGLKWGGDFTDKDLPHFQANVPLNDLLNGKTRTLYSDFILEKLNRPKVNTPNTSGYRRMNSAGKELQDVAQRILVDTKGQPMGTKVPFNLGGKEYLAVREEHVGGRVEGQHPGISLFEKV